MTDTSKLFPAGESFITSTFEKANYNFEVMGYDQKPIFSVSHDGIVTFGDHLTPAEGSEQAFRMLLDEVETYNALKKSCKTFTDMAEQFDAEMSNVAERAIAGGRG